MEWAKQHAKIHPNEHVTLVCCGNRSQDNVGPLSPHCYNVKPNVMCSAYPAWIKQFSNHAFPRHLDSNQRHQSKQD